jgi:glycerophosphoryl diester phosphodiesterase
MAALKGKGLIVLDLKENGLGRPLADVIRREEMLNQMVACCWNDAQLADIREYLPEIPILKLGGVPDKCPADFCLGWHRQGAAGFSLSHDSLSPAFMAQANGAGMGVYTWTINATPQFREALQLGVAGVLTDAPQYAHQELRRLLAEAWGRRREAE